jgi:hypothetical protein
MSLLMDYLVYRKSGNPAGGKSPAGRKVSCGKAESLLQPGGEPSEAAGYSGRNKKITDRRADAPGRSSE